MTHIQLDQITATPDPKRRDALLAVVAAIPSKRIPTDGAIWGLSKWNEAKWGSGTNDIKIGDVTGGNANHNADGLLVATAAADADFFVTDEKRLPKKVRRLNSKLAVICFEEFRQVLK